ncbi:MAG: hypothetical protein KAI24_14780 [Planctomycetes bacterium]|nr:hypothetical protein [Planctomycetota bacterium]
MSNNLPSSRSSLVFRAFAVALAVGVVVWLIVRAQQSAQPRDAGVVPAAGSGEPVQPPADGEPALLYSSKSAPVPVVADPNTPLLPSSKVLVLPDEAEEQAAPAVGGGKQGGGKR